MHTATLKSKPSQEEFVFTSAAPSAAVPETPIKTAPAPAVKSSPAVKTLPLKVTQPSMVAAGDFQLFTRAGTPLKFVAKHATLPDVIFIETKDGRQNSVLVDSLEQNEALVIILGR